MIRNPGIFDKKTNFETISNLWESFQYAVDVIRYSWILYAYFALQLERDILFPTKQLDYHVILIKKAGNLVYKIVATMIFGPTDLGGWSYRLTHVRPFVRSFVSYQFFSETDHRISLIFCIKLAYYKSKKVTKPDFRKKKCLGPNLGPNQAQNEVFGRYLEKKSLDFDENFSNCRK